jgi:arylsulfatase A-like enzyme
MKTRQFPILQMIAVGVLIACTAGPSCSPSKGKPPNVVLVIVDALRPDYLGCYGCDRPTSPNIDGLAAEGTLFETAISQAPWTKPSFSTMLTSLYPFQHGVVDWESVMPDSVVTLAEVLRAHGYKTAAVINMLGITGDFKVTKGFEVVSEAPKRSRDAAGTTDDAIALIKESPRPFFIMVHYFDAHWPRRPPPEYVALVRSEGDPDPFAAVAGGTQASAEPGPERVDRQRLLYAACVRYVDDAVGRLVEFLDRAGLGRETLLIVTADHGEAFWEHSTVAHGANLYDEVVKVPLIVRCPSGGQGGRRVACQVRHVDLLPTIVDFAGAADAEPREGMSLRSLIGGSGGGESVTAKHAGSDSGKIVPHDVALSETRLKKAPETRSARTLSEKLILEPATGLRELYDLRSDPEERVNIWGREAAGADSLEQLLTRLPGSSINGWRVALTGDAPRSGQAMDVTAGVGAGGRLTRVRTVTGSGELAVDVAPDSTSLKITSRPDGLQIVLFDVEPEGTDVTFRATCEGTGGPAAVEVGEVGRGPIGRSFTLSTRAAAGLPRSFKQARASRAPSLSVWWLPGDKVGKVGARAALTAETMRRLRSLGYVQ